MEHKEEESRVDLALKGEAQVDVSCPKADPHFLSLFSPLSDQRLLLTFSQVCVHVWTKKKARWAHAGGMKVGGAFRPSEEFFLKKVNYKGESVNTGRI